MRVARRTLPPLTLVLALALAAASAACTDPPSAPGAPPLLAQLPRALTTAEQGAIVAGNDFSLALLREVNGRKPGENLFISPFSASVALGMTMNGADGATLEAMQRTLGLTGHTAQEMNEAYQGLSALLVDLDATVTFRSANSIWYRETFPFEASFLTTAQSYFDAEVRPSNFEDVAGTAAAINGWAAEQTNGKIERVLDTIEPDDVMMLMNALYFKGAWRTQFDPRLTAPAPFTRADGSQATVNMMFMKESALRAGWSDGVQAAELPYGNGAYAMTILLPDEGGAVDELVTSLTPERWATILGSMTDSEMDLYLPRFTVRYSDEWNDVLTALGMGIAFTPRQADFTRMSPLGRELYISFVKQDAFVEVNEEGTEAAAVTTVGIKVVSAPPSFRVDRPFVFAIRERLSGTILFVGKVATLPAGV